MLNIAHYQHAHEFLLDSWQEKRKKNSAFSLRSWARQLGMSSHAPLNLMLQGKRSISKKHLPALIRSLELNPKEGLYLESLIGYNQSKTSLEKELYFSRLRDLTPNEPIQAHEMDTFKLLGDPLHFQVLEMTQLANFDPSPLEIQARLRSPTSTRDIEAALARLLKLGLLRIEGERYKKTYQFVSNKPDLADFGSQSYHKAVSALAAELISQVPLLEREYNGYTVSINRKSLPKAKQLIRDFACRFLKEIEITQGQGEETYQFNLQFFPVTQPKPALGGKK